MTSLKRASVFLRVDILYLGYGETFENSYIFSISLFSRLWNTKTTSCFFFLNKKSYVVDPWTTQVWTAYVHLYVDFFNGKCYHTMLSTVGWIWGCRPVDIEDLLIERADRKLYMDFPLHGGQHPSSTPPAVFSAQLWFHTKNACPPPSSAGPLHSLPGSTGYN